MTKWRSSRQWWEATRDDPARLLAWLDDQYRGEATAAGRIEALRDLHAEPGSRAHRILTAIAAQERRHAGWVADLLRARGVEPAPPRDESRYWNEPLAAISDLATGCAVGAHAESMRLERIETICDDPAAPPDVRSVFARILPEERFHERAFRSLSTPEALDATQDAHALGRAALGLHP